MTSALKSLYLFASRRIVPPFEWMVTHAADGTFLSLWPPDQPSDTDPYDMLLMLYQLRRGFDVNIHDLAISLVKETARDYGGDDLQSAVEPAFAAAFRVGYRVYRFKEASALAHDPNWYLLDKYLKEHWLGVVLNALRHNDLRNLLLPFKTKLSARVVARLYPAPTLEEFLDRAKG